MENQPTVTIDDVLKGVKTVEVLARDGTQLALTVKAMDWRTTFGATFKRTEDGLIHILENCIGKAEQELLNKVTPLHLIWLANVAQQLTNGVDALKKATATPQPATTPPTLGTPPLPPSNAN